MMSYRCDVGTWY